MLALSGINCHMLGRILPVRSVAILLGEILHRLVLYFVGIANKFDWHLLVDLCIRWLDDFAAEAERGPHIVDSLRLGCLLRAKLKCRLHSTFHAAFCVIRLLTLNRRIRHRKLRIRHIFFVHHGLSDFKAVDAAIGFRYRLISIIIYFHCLELVIGLRIIHSLLEWNLLVKYL